MKIKYCLILLTAALFLVCSHTERYVYADEETEESEASSEITSPSADAGTSPAGEASDDEKTPTATPTPTPTATATPTATPTPTPTPAPAETPAPDTAPPVIAVSGIDAFGVYSSLPDIIVMISDDTDDDILYDLSITGDDGEKFSGLDINEDASSGNLILSISLNEDMPDGVYRLKVDSSDLSGNTASAETEFTISREAPVFSVGEGAVNEAGYLLPGSALVLTESSKISVIESMVSLFMNGKLRELAEDEYSFMLAGHDDLYLYRYEIFPEIFSSDGYYVLTVSDIDASGRNNIYSVEFMVDATKPVISVTGLEDGAVYRDGQAYILSVGDNIMLEEFEVTANGRTAVYIYDAGYFVNKDDPEDMYEAAPGSFELTLAFADKPYTVSFAAADGAGNTSRTGEFTVSFEQSANTDWVIPAAVIAACAVILLLRRRNREKKENKKPAR